MKCQSVNTGIMAAFKERDEMVAIFTGHDHKNDFAVDFDKVLVGYTRKTGYGSYGPADGKLHGGRILKVKESSRTLFRRTAAWTSRSLSPTRERSRTCVTVCTLLIRSTTTRISAGSVCCDCTR